MEGDFNVKENIISWFIYVVGTCYATNKDDGG